MQNQMHAAPKLCQPHPHPTPTAAAVPLATIDAARRLQDWNLLRSFIVVFELGTLTAAAGLMQLTQPTVGRHIREIEALVGETLFDRLPQRMQPTQRAVALYDALGPLRDGAQSFERTLLESGGRLSGTVRVTSSESFGVLVLPGLLVDLLAAEPGLHVELSATDGVQNLLRREADIAVRFFRPEQDDLITTRVGDVEFGLYAHADFLQRHGRPRDPTDLFGHFVGALDLQNTFEHAQEMGYAMQRSHFKFQSGSELAQLSAIAAGVGCGVVPAYAARRTPRLERLFADSVVFQVPVWLCAHDDLRRSPRLRRVFDHLADSIRRELPPA